MVETPLATARFKAIATRPVVAPILCLLPGFLSMIDDALIAHLGFYRDPATLAAVPYFANLPDDLGDCDVFVVDPMLATGRSDSAANTMLEERGARNFTLVCSSASPEGVKTIQAQHPSVRIVTAAIDERLNDQGYIGQGLGDAGYRMFGSASSVAVGARVV